MTSLLTLDVARDAVARQFADAPSTYPSAARAALTPRTDRTRSALSGLLRRVAALVVPAGYRTAQ